MARRIFVDHEEGPVLSELAVGTAGEHLVCADLLLMGYNAFMADQNCAYDVVVEVADRLLRVQVKTTQKHRKIPQRKGHFPAYIWNVRRTGRAGLRVYAAGDFDLLALVALDVRKIAYLVPARALNIVQIRTHEDAGSRSGNGGGPRGKVFSMFAFHKALKEI